MDGENIGSVTTYGHSNFSPNHLIKFGNQYTDYYHGALDDFCFWDRSLTDEEVLLLPAIPMQIVGCTDSSACNYNALALMEGEDCEYNCCDALEIMYNGVVAPDTITIPQGESIALSTGLNVDSASLFELNMPVSSNQSHALPLLELGKTYRLQVAGRYGVADGWSHADAAYDYAWDTISNSKVNCNGTQDAIPYGSWLLDGNEALEWQRPDNDLDNNEGFCDGVDKTYWWTIQGDGLSHQLGFIDCCYGDNSGALDFQLFELIDEELAPIWSNGDTSYSTEFVPLEGWLTVQEQNSGSCVDSVFIQIAVPGCTDELACNYDSDATTDDGTCIPSGCLDLEACNFNPLAECSGEACQYTCCPGPGCCLDGTVWDTELGGCVVIEPWCSEDIDDDGVIGANDLLLLLSYFGNECEGTPDQGIDNWMCGINLDYQGYSYSTVQIGGQCWFSENLRADSFRNGVPVTFVSSSDDWGINSPRYCYWENNPEHASQHGNLYNWFAATDANGLCPTSWHVPSDEEWAILEGYIGVPEEELFETGWRGISQGTSLLSATESGTDDFGFNALISGVRGGTGIFGGPSATGFWTSSAKDYQDGWARTLELGESRILRYHDDWKKNGNSIRCIRD